MPNKIGKEAKMLKVAYDITKAKEVLIKKYGLRNYQKLISKIREKAQKIAKEADVSEVTVLGIFSQDKRFDPVIRLAAIAAMGE